MAETKWTKGPWRLFDLDGKLKPIREIKSSHGEASHYQATLKASVEIVCKLDFGYGKSCDEANARLIAAAPELYDACSYALTQLEDMSTEQFRLGADKEIRSKLGKALAKACG